jgi:peptidoglycan/xylan/chitin deacetylase (PgdA/CDA1 family)
MKAAARAPILFAVTGIDFFYGVQTKICAYMIASPFTDMRTQMDMPARDLVGYGAHRPEGRWPNGARLAVSVVVNYEEGSERSHAMRDADQESMTEFGSYAFPANVRSLAMESMYEYGSRVGVWRILESLRDAGVPATLFACALAFEQNPEVARAVVAQGHEVCSHGYRWEEVFRLSEEEERAHIRMAIESLERTCGKHAHARMDANDPETIET